MNRKYIYYPLALFLALFALDKLALITALQEYGRSDASPIENIQMSMELRRQSDSEDSAFRKDYIFLGTSRSEVFKFLHEKTISESRFITPETKRALQGIRYDTSGVFKASELLVHYVNLETIFSRGVRPDLVVLEISPEMFNLNSPTNLQNYFSKNIFYPRHLYTLLPITEGKLRIEVLSRFLFSSYALRFRPELAIQNISKGKNYREKSLLPVMMLLKLPLVEELPANKRDFQADSVPPDDFQLRFIDYSNEIANETFLSNYRFDRTELRILEAIIELCQRERIKLAIWFPVVHDILEEHLKKTEFYHFYPEIEKVITSSQTPYYNAKVEVPECDYYTDSSHLSGRCAPEVIARILKRAGELD